jgi:predicted nucleic acid-binding protein
MFVDTNVLVYASVQGAPDREKARAALTKHTAAGEALCVSRQVLREFIAVVTRPQVWAQPVTQADAAATALILVREFDILEDGPAVWDKLIDLCQRFTFGGRQVHDANIVATVLAHGESRLMTFNVADFRRLEVLVEVVAP